MKFLCQLYLTAYMLAIPSCALCGQHPNDLGIADTVDMVFMVGPDAAGSELHVQIDLWVFNDSNNIIGASMGYNWDYPNLRLDSAIASDLTATGLDYGFYYWQFGDDSLTNANHRFGFTGFRKLAAGVQELPERRPWASYFFTLTDWNAADSIVIDTGMYNHGTKWLLVDDNQNSYTPYWKGVRVQYDASVQCCIGLTGNVDNSSDNVVDIADLTALIDYLFISYTEPVCVEEANIDGDPESVVDIGDLTAFIDYLFITFALPAPCQ